MQRRFLMTVVLFASIAFTVAAQQPGVSPAARGAAGRVPTTPMTTASVTPPRGMIARVLPGARNNAFTLIQGNALNSTNGSLPDSLVRLRDARYGHIVDTQLTDRSGLFAFRAVDPGSYIVELVGNDQTILAASQMLSVNAGETVLAVVKLPFRIPPFAGLLGHTASSAAAVSSAAAASGVLATAASGADASPQ